MSANALSLKLTNNAAALAARTLELLCFTVGYACAVLARDGLLAELTIPHTPVSAAHVATAAVVFLLFGPHQVRAALLTTIGLWVLGLGSFFEGRVLPRVPRGHAVHQSSQNLPRRDDAPTESVRAQGGRENGYE